MNSTKEVMKDTTAKFNDCVKNYVLYVFVLLVFLNSTQTSFAQLDKKDIIFTQSTRIIDDWIGIDSTTVRFVPTYEEVLLAKGISMNHIDSLQKSQSPKSLAKIGKILKYDLSDYYRQYVGYINDEGDRIIYINAICSKEGDWANLSKNFPIILGGGSCYFDMRINISTKKCIYFCVNDSD